jgi:hypothetical protein
MTFGRCSIIHSKLSYSQDKLGMFSLGGRKNLDFPSDLFVDGQKDIV